MKIDNWSTVDSALEALRGNDKADVEHYIRELDRENNELRKDKERLDWLFKFATMVHGCDRPRHIDDRDDIDEAMKEEA